MTHDEQVQAIMTDMRGKIHRRDWHGVADCAMDLRELDALERGRQEVRNDQERSAKAVLTSGISTANGARPVHLGAMQNVRQNRPEKALTDLGSVSLDSPLG
jgi:hypothetical protein